MAGQGFVEQVEHHELALVLWEKSILRAVPVHKLHTHAVQYVVLPQRI